MHSKGSRKRAKGSHSLSLWERAGVRAPPPPSPSASFKTRTCAPRPTPPPTPPPPPPAPPPAPRPLRFVKTPTRPPRPSPHPTPLQEGEGVRNITIHRPQGTGGVAKLPRERTVIRLPSYEQVRSDAVLYAHANRVLHLETNPR